jgi:hypothetical protein
MGSLIFFLANKALETYYPCLLEQLKIIFLDK